MECGRQDSNLHGLPRSPSRARGSWSTGFQSQRVCQFRHARNAWCLRSGRAELDSPAVCSSTSTSLTGFTSHNGFLRWPSVGHPQISNESPMKNCISTLWKTCAQAIDHD
jgi:hypothetical protein